MPSTIVLDNLDQPIYHELEKRAATHKHSLADEVKDILAACLGSPGADWSEVDAIYNRLAASGRSFSDSAELLREDRDR